MMDLIELHDLIKSDIVKKTPNEERQKELDMIEEQAIETATQEKKESSILIGADRDTQLVNMETVNNDFTESNLNKEDLSEEPNSSTRQGRKGVDQTEERVVETAIEKNRETSMLIDDSESINLENNKGVEADLNEEYLSNTNNCSKKIIESSILIDDDTNSQLVNMETENNDYTQPNLNEEDLSEEPNSSTRQGKQDLDKTEDTAVKTAIEKNRETSMLIDDTESINLENIKGVEVDSNEEYISRTRNYSEKIIESSILFEDLTKVVNLENSINLLECNTEYIPDDSVMCKSVCEDVLSTSLRDRVIQEIQESLKSENLTFECTLCFENFPDEDSYNIHSLIHLKQDTDNDSDTSQLEAPPVSKLSTPAYNTRSKSRHSTTADKNNHKSKKNSSAAHTRTSVARHKNNEKQTKSEETDDITKNKFVTKIDRHELNNNFSNDINLKKIDDDVKNTRKCKRKDKKENIPNNKSEDFRYKRSNQNEVPAKYKIDTQKVKIHNINSLKNEQSESICFNNKSNVECVSSVVNNLHSRTGQLHEIKQFTCETCHKMFKHKRFLVKHIRVHTDDRLLICKICSCQCKYKSSLISHMRVHTGDKPFSCTSCEYKTAHNSSLVLHMRTHTGEKPFCCHLCKYKCAQSSSLVVHMRTHTGTKPFSCKLCEFKCAISGTLVTHMRTHNGDKPFSCNLCKSKFSTTSAVASHMMTHAGSKPFCCNLCDFKCKQKTNLILHMRTHTGAKPFSCDLCEYKCALKGTLVRHMRSHTGAKPFSCKLCEYKCAQKCGLVRHMRIHTGEKPFSCKLCDYKGTRNDALVTHMRTHTGEKPFSCKFCENKFAQRQVLVTHMRTHTGEKPFFCRLCDYKCTRNSFLTLHMRTHTGERPFSCEICEYKCSLKGALVGHMKTHRGDKPFSCELCKYKCVQKSDLVIHMRCHTGVKPFSCELCQFKCARRSSLVRHMRTHIDAKPFSFK